MFYNPNAIDNATAVRSTYVLFATPDPLAGSPLTVAEVNAAVAGVTAPITVLFIVKEDTDVPLKSSDEDGKIIPINEPELL